jgi:putative FmdB family regulatory protein
MPLYDYRCPAGHRFEQLAPIATSAQQDCPACGQASAKVPSRVSLGGHADPGPAMEQMPQTWRGTHEGNPEYLGQLRRQWNDRQKLEEKYDELRGDRRPVLAHEGRYHAAPLRAGDPPASSARPAAPTPAAADAGPATAAGRTAPQAGASP